MITDCETKTVTEITDGVIQISCVCRESVDKPTIFRSDLLNEVKTINKTKGVEGELLLTHTDSAENIGLVNEKGELIITTNDDNADNYYVDDNQNLIYNE